MPGEPPENPAEQSPFGEALFAYTRSMAIHDGALIDVSTVAREAGIKFPVAVTQRLWHERIEATKALQKLGQDTQGRLWDTLWMLRMAILADGEGSVVEYEVLYLSELQALETQQLRSVCGPDDDGSPCITIMLPDED